MKILKNFSIAIILLGLAFGIVWLLSPNKPFTADDRAPVIIDAQDTPIKAPETREGLIDRIQKDPEEWVATEELRRASQVAPAVASSPPSPHIRRNPSLFSEKVLPDDPRPQPTDVSDLYFWEDFASLRTDAVRNPDSGQNRATIEAILQKRSERLAEDKN